MLTGDMKTDNILELLKSIIAEENIIKRFQVIEIVLHIMDENTQLKVNAKSFKKLMKEIYADKELLQKIKFYCNIIQVPETALEYFGRDYASNPEYSYDPEFNDKIDSINTEINKFIGLVIKQLTDSETDGFMM